jgi:hypothetical protein
MSDILCYGGGTETTALLCLVAEGHLPVPDHIIMADTGREVVSTWRYLETIRPWLAAHGLPQIKIAHPGLARVGIYSHRGELLLPAFTETGKLRTFCSTEWKARPVTRLLRQIGVTRETRWLGFSLDETRRIKDNPDLRYPLVELGVARTDCVRIIQRAGLPLPRKSRCWCCPYQTDQEWREMGNSSQDWEAAVALDEAIREHDERGGVWLHHSRQPLRSARLDKLNLRRPSCQQGLCFV